MKKLQIFLGVLLTSVFSSSAQTAQVATLSHEGNISTFYSGNALKDAYDKASDGDIITLSSGPFSAPSQIAKNITIRGAGMMPDENPTILTGDIAVQCPSSESTNLTFEGIYHNGNLNFRSSKDANIIKCMLKQLYLSGYAATPNTNLKFIHTHIINLPSNSSSDDASFINCIVYSSTPIHLKTGSFTNCFFASSFGFNNSSLKNCILFTSSTSSSYLSSSTASHCYAIGTATNIFGNSPSATNVVHNSLTPADIFKDVVNYELKDEYSGSWLGDDGTQVGIHGGSLPFDPTPTNPQITKFNVSPKTTADGMLSVDIEVKPNE